MNTYVQANVAGNLQIADTLLSLYLSGQKSAGSSLVKDFEMAATLFLRLATTGSCAIAESAQAEGEGDLSVAYWLRAHAKFFEPFLQQWGISCLDDAQVVREHFKFVWK